MEYVGINKKDSKQYKCKAVAGNSDQGPYFDIKINSQSKSLSKKMNLFLKSLENKIYPPQRTNCRLALNTLNESVFNRTQKIFL